LLSFAKVSMADEILNTNAESVNAKFVTLEIPTNPSMYKKTIIIKTIIIDKRYLFNPSPPIVLYQLTFI
jgi:hypothetical protein